MCVQQPLEASDRLDTHVGPRTDYWWNADTTIVPALDQRWHVAWEEKHHLNHNRGTRKLEKMHKKIGEKFVDLSAIRRPMTEGSSS